MMSHRGKRQALSRLDDITPVATKRRKGRPTAAAEEEEAAPLEQRQSYSSVASDMKISSIYNRSVTDAPAELFRKDLISAMKLPDSEPLTSDHYWVITDQWKQEWERGVQVPVKPDSLPGPVVNIASSYVNNPRKMHHEFKLPKNKYIRITKDEHFRVDEHYLSNVGIQAEKSCAYDLEDVDVVWLNILNGERALMGLRPISQDQLERVIEELEMRCWEKVHAIVKKEEGLALEFDESVICDVCRSPDSEEGNEMVFCDCCNICVHQACYGITSIPAGSWLCRTCALGLRPECVLCPNKNGAMKSTRSGQKWAHVSCALWIPEVSIGCVERMEPITKISGIPQSRWALICVLCRERVGACIQCSVKTCKTAYHVTCAFKHGLEMRAIIDEESTTDDDNTVKLRSYCQKHSTSSKKESNSIAGTGSDEEVKKKQRKDMTTEEKTHARAVKLQEIEAEFEKHVNVKDITRKYDVDPEGLEYIYNYWVLKRRASFNKPLLAARSEDASDVMNKNQEQVDQEKMSMFIQLRQDLERVRNLCYMVSRREKLSRTYQRFREQTFYKQVDLLSDTSINLNPLEVTAIKDSNHGPSIYDRLYSHANAPDLSTDFETMLHMIAGDESELSPHHGVNGYIFSPSGKDGKRSGFNGELCKSSGFSESLSSSVSDIDSKSHAGVETESDTHCKLNSRMNKSQRKNNVENRIKNTARRRQKTTSSFPDSTTSTEVEEDEDGGVGADRAKNTTRGGARPPQRSKKNAAGRSKKQPSSFELLEERMLGSRSGSVTAGDDDTEDDLFNLGKPSKGSGFKKKAISDIYSSDSDSTDKDAASSRSSASRKPIRTKASVKEFSAAGSGAGRSKERAGSSSKSVSFSSASKVTTTMTTTTTTTTTTSSSTTTSHEKRKRMNDLFDEGSDDARRGAVDGRLSASESEVFVPQRKAAMVANETLTPAKSKSRAKGEHAATKKKSPSSSSHEKKAQPPRKESPMETADGYDGGANYLDTLTLVPQRAAAKKAIKAIEHIKNGMVKPAANFDDAEMDAFKTSSKSKLPKKDPHTATVTAAAAAVVAVKPARAAADADDAKPDHTRTPLTADKRIPHPKSASSISSAFHLSDTATSCSASSSVTVTCPGAAAASCPNAAVASSCAASIAAKPTLPGTRKASTSSSGSSSGSSSSNSSSSSSSTSSASSGSSSSDSSTSNSSSSSSSDSETEDAPGTVAARKPPQPPGKAIPATVHKAMPECKKREAELAAARSHKLAVEVGSQKVDREESKPSDIAGGDRSRDTEQTCKAASPVAPKAVDDSSFLETKAAIEHLANDEQNFMLPSSACWEPSTAADVVKLESGLDDASKPDGGAGAPSPMLQSSRSRSLFSPIKDSDLCNFDDDMNENNNLIDSSFSLPPLPFSFSSDLAYKEDTKEDSVRETLNLVEKLKLEMARKKNADAPASDATPDLIANRVAGDAADKEELDEAVAVDVDRSKSDDSVTDSQLTSSDTSTMETTADDHRAAATAATAVAAVQEPPPSAADLFNSCTFPTDMLHPKESPATKDTATPPPIAPNDSHDDSTTGGWQPSTHTYDESNSPYQQDVVCRGDRWSESVMIPSRRSDCSSVSVSSASSSSSACSEQQQQQQQQQQLTNEMMAKVADVEPHMDLMPTLEMSEHMEMSGHMQKSVVDLLRPVARAAANENQLFSGAGEIPDNLYAYEDHLSSFAASMADKAALYAHSQQPNGQSSALFQPSMGFDAVGGFANTNPLMGKQYTQPLSIQTPCAATASFTTTLQNMAIITSIISPTVRPHSSDEIAAATPVSGDGNSSVNFAEKLAAIVSESAAELVNDVPCGGINTTSVTSKATAADALSSPLKPTTNDYADGNEKENTALFKNLVPVSEAAAHAIRPPAEKTDGGEVEANAAAAADLLRKVAEESVTVTSNQASTNEASATAPAPVATPPTTAPPVAAKTAPATPASTKKSPVKPTRVSARVMSQNKSPVAKSPIAAGVSPARLESAPTAVKGKSREPGSRKNHKAKGAGSRRGKGRGRGRNPFANFHRDWDGDTIHNKLIGTVYDFDDEDDATGDNFENLRAMRERRKSTDTAYCDRLSTSSKDTCYSPKFASPSSQQPQPPPHSKRKGSVAGTTPDRRASHRGAQLSPLCEIGNNGRVLPKDHLYRDATAATPDEDDDEEDEDQAEEEEEDEEEHFAVATAATTSEKSSSRYGAVRGGDHRHTSSSSSPTLPQPPVQTSVAEFSAVQPLLPGPVDMRTYSGGLAYDSGSAAALDGNVAGDAGADHILGATFAETETAAAEPLPDLVDALEKEMIERYATAAPVSAVGRGSKTSPAVTASPRVANDAIAKSAAAVAGNQLESMMPTEATAVLIVDDTSVAWRNQLKMKIKGPYSDANYASVTTASVTVVATQPLPSISSGGGGAVTSDCFAAAVGSLAATAVSSAASSSNLRRMRKKELLELYKDQGVLDECGNDIMAAASQSSAMMGDAAAVGAASNAPVKSGPSYKLPKAVASMTTIPTKEDYKAVLENTAAYIEKKKRGKDKSCAAFDVVAAVDISNNNNGSGGGAGGNYNNNNNNSNAFNNNKQPGLAALEKSGLPAGAGGDSITVIDNHVGKRKSRGASVAPPKLKIKFGGLSSSVVVADSVCSVTAFEEKNLRLRPPKKRLCDQSDGTAPPTPLTYEQLKRESMKYRSQVISEFNENGRGDSYEAAGDEELSQDEHVTGGGGGETATAVRKRKKRSSSATSSAPKGKRKKRQQRDADDEDATIRPHVRVIRNVESGEGAPKKIIIKFGGLNPPPAAAEPPASALSSPPPPPMPAKPAKSSKRNMNHELDSVRTNKTTPIRLKISRSKEGYVTNCSDEVSAEAPAACTASPAKAATVLPDAPPPSVTEDATAVAASSSEGASAAGSADAQVPAVSTSTS